jgi:hypothetical protein
MYGLIERNAEVKYTDLNGGMEVTKGNTEMFSKEL